MRDDLIGFVVGALDETEHQSLCRKLEQDEQLRGELRRVERHLRMLQPARQQVTPPAGLAERTCARLNDLLDGTRPMPSDLSGPFTAGVTETFGPTADANSLLNSSGPPNRSAATPAHDPAHQVVQPFGDWGSSRLDAASLERWKFADFVVTAGVCVAVACLFFPALINSRFHSEAALCQNRLRQSGQKLTMYSQEHNNHYPMVDASGNAAVAGIYTVKLAQQGLVDDPRCFQCPGKNWTLMLSIPRWEDLLNAKGAELTSMHVVMGGDYAYTLPYLDRGRLQGIRNVGSKYAPVLADAPLENARNVSISSHGRGQNVLFQDGHVRFLTTRIRPGAYPDDVFFNDQGRIRAGVHNEDFVLGASHVSPLAGQSR